MKWLQVHQGAESSDPGSRSRRRSLPRVRRQNRKSGKGRKGNSGLPGFDPVSFFAEK